MADMTSRESIFLSGMVWLGLGALLMYKGIRWVECALYEPQHSLFISAMKEKVGTLEKSALFLVSLSLFIGFLKGRFVLRKTVQRVVSRIHNLPPPIRFTEMYDRKYLMLLIGMASLGVLFRLISLPFDLRGGLDIAIGSSLLSGSILYFRELVRKV